MNYNTCSCWSASWLPHLTVAAHITVRTSAGSHDKHQFLTPEKQYLEKGGECQALLDMIDGESIKHWREWLLQLNSLALGQTTFISVAGSTIHASTCKGHCNRCLNGCRSKGQADTESTTMIWHHKITQEQPGTCEEGINGCTMRCKTTVNTKVQAADELKLQFTCVTFIGVKLDRRGALWAGAGVAAGPEETEVAAHVLTGVGYWRGKSKQTINTEMLQITSLNYFQIWCNVLYQ